MPTNERWKWTFAVGHGVGGTAVLLVILRLVAWYNTAIISRDSVIYINLAKDWVSGQYLKALAHPYHPLYSFLIAAVSKGLGFSFPHAAVGISILASALTLPALDRIFRRSSDRRVLILGLLFFTVSPYLIRYSADILTEPLYLFWIAWSAAFWIEGGDSKKPWYFFFSGISAGLAYLTRPEGLLVVSAGILWLFIGYRKYALKDLFIYPLLVVLGTLLVASPYILYLHQDSGQWLLTRKKRIGTLERELSLKKNFPKSIQVGNSWNNPRLLKGVSKRRAMFLLNRRRWQADLAVKIRQAQGTPKGPKVRPGGGVWQWLYVLLGSLGYVLFGFLKGMFLPIGMWVIFRFFSFRRYPWSREDTFILVFSTLYWMVLGVLLTGYGYVSRRHYSAVMMFWSIWAAIGFMHVCEWVASFIKAHRWTTKTVGTFLLIPILGISVVKGTRPYRIGKYGRKLVGRWLSTVKPKDHPCKVLTSMPRIGYYAGCRTVYLPAIHREDIYALQRHEINFVVLNRRETKRLPVLLNLLKKYGYCLVYHYRSERRHEDLRVFAYRGESHGG